MKIGFMRICTPYFKSVLRKDIKIIDAENEELKARNKVLEEDNARLDKEVRYLTAQLFKMTLEMEEMKRKDNVSSCESPQN